MLLHTFTVKSGQLPTNKLLPIRYPPDVPFVTFWP